MTTNRISRRAALLAATALSVGALSLGAASSAYAQVYTNVQIGPPPPPAQVYVPSPRAGYVWAPAHYEYRHGNYVWTRGYWMRDRPGYAYSPPNWQRRGNGWAYQAARWDRSPVPAYGNGPRWRDRDRDGVPDRYDRRPGRADNRGDRDRDGVPNRYDRQPDNPYRR